MQKKRIWIASPFIGAIKDIKKIIGGRWMLPSIDFRILTDIESGFIRQDSYNEFFENKIEIRHLLSIHAKIYIVDDWCLVTSANLTGTAFFCRYEMGISSDDASEVSSRFDNWWKKATIVESLIKKPNKSMADYQDSNRFPRKFKSQPYRNCGYDKYEAACEKYIEFAKLYEKITGRIHKMANDGYTLLQEVDYMFNFLYHDHPDTPSNGQFLARELSSLQQEKAILKAYKETAKRYEEYPQKWRLAQTKTIQHLLSPKAIKKLDWKGVSTVANCLHCLNSFAINSRSLKRV